ncbi:MAG: hypothetical protein K1X26_11280 [Chitinophagales bacterium]|nr:hypothetical protein [Chitinophagales bacterium]HMU99318.1 hypothetical protein [Chitinophagales bacterium]HMV03209.1 hypothetical protein [Chitinophagales bacterium]HMW95474.1 hypothetical protein [Chitinophagales bacterium]HMZ69150.1 hypothetical protein [Chitinophagales bacterium]
MSNFGDSLFMYNVDSPEDFISKYDNFTDSIKNQNNVIGNVVVELEDVLTNFEAEDEIKTEIHKIFDKYITLADEMDKQKILVITGTALGSVEYWNNNIQLIESNEQNQRINKLKQVMEFVLADATCGAYGGPAGVICSGLMALSW